MAVNSWLITIKRRIKLPLVPPGGGTGVGDAAISGLEQYCSTRAGSIGSNVLQLYKSEMKTNFIMM